MREEEIGPAGVALRRHDGDAETVGRTHRLQERGVARPIRTEAKVEADRDMGDAEPTDNDFPHEGVGGLARQSLVEGQRNGGVDACPREEDRLLPLRREAKERLAGEEGAGMRLEGEGEAGGVGLA